MMGELSHINEKGEATMVDVSAKEETLRYARATGRIRVGDAVLKAVSEGSVSKGDVLGTARIAGIMAAKKTPELIPLCHPLLLTKISVDFEVLPERKEILCTCEVRLTGKTGVEMEALTGVSVALLTIYDMCKAIDKSMAISGIGLEEKSGGKSGTYLRKEEPHE
jgi:cyclic pyranopterin phosphate synthase